MAQSSDMKKTMASSSPSSVRHKTVISMALAEPVQPGGEDKSAGIALMEEKNYSDIIEDSGVYGMPVGLKFALIFVLFVLSVTCGG